MLGRLVITYPTSCSWCSCVYQHDVWQGQLRVPLGPHLPGGLSGVLGFHMDAQGGDEDSLDWSQLCA